MKNSRVRKPEEEGYKGKENWEGGPHDETYFVELRTKGRRIKESLRRGVETGRRQAGYGEKITRLSRMKVQGGRSEASLCKETWRK